MHFDHQNFDDSVARQDRQRLVPDYPPIPNAVHDDKGRFEDERPINGQQPSSPPPEYSETPPTEDPPGRGRQMSVPSRRNNGADDGGKSSGAAKRTVAPINRRSPAARPPGRDASSNSKQPSAASSVKTGSSSYDPQDPRARLQAALKSIGSADWEDKVDGIRRLDELMASNADAVAADVHTVALALLLEVNPINSWGAAAGLPIRKVFLLFCFALGR